MCFFLFWCKKRNSALLSANIFAWQDSWRVLHWLWQCTNYNFSPLKGLSKENKHLQSAVFIIVIFKPVVLQMKSRCFWAKCTFRHCMVCTIWKCFRSFSTSTAGWLVKRAHVQIEVSCALGCLSSIRCLMPYYLTVPVRIIYTTIEEVIVQALIRVCMYVERTCACNILYTS